MVKDFILASSSRQRYALLEQIGYLPELTEAADIDETPRRFEKPSAYVKRMALEKARHVAEKHSGKGLLTLLLFPAPNSFRKRIPKPSRTR